MSTGFGQVTVIAAPPHRNGPAKPPPATTFALQSGTATFAWGFEPGTADLVYNGDGYGPVTIGWSMNIILGPHTFWGVCVSDEPILSDKGNRRQIRFEDNRRWLSHDQVYCCFNKLDDHIVNGRRLKRYVHYFPDQQANYNLDASYNLTVGENSGLTQISSGVWFSGLIKAYTDKPLPASIVLDLIFNATTVFDGWVRQYHIDQTATPCYDVDAFGGKALNVILQEVSEQQGLTMTLMGGPFRLVWCRKGTDCIGFPFLQEAISPPQEKHPQTGVEVSLTNDLSYGTSLSGFPSMINILGDRNLYQVHEIPMVPSWSPGWTQFWNLTDFREDIYQRGKLTADATILGATYKAGTPFKTIGPTAADPEMAIARQMADVLAMTITVGGYAALRGETLFVDEPYWADYAKMAGRSRLDMPAQLYIEQVVFRAFTFPDGFEIINALGNPIPIDSLQIADKLIARVTIADPVAGTMQWDSTQSADGNGFGIIQGYEVGSDAFRLANPDRFNLQAWLDTQAIWTHAEFQIDDDGTPNGKTIIFNNPVIKSGTLIGQIDGLAYPVAHPTNSLSQPGFDIPAVKIACCFEAERYEYTSGIPGKAATYAIAGLRAEIAMTYGQNNATEIPYADGLLSGDKARQYIAPLNLLQYAFAKGYYTHALVPDSKGDYETSIQINPYLDRVSVTFSPSSAMEKGEYATERPREFYTPERDLERFSNLNTLFPGQAQLRQDITAQKTLVKALQTDRQILKTMTDAFNQMFGDGIPVPQIPVLSGAANPTSVTLPVGTPIWKKPTDTDGATSVNTVAVPPTEVTAQHSIFAGVTTRDGEIIGQGQQIPVKNTGIILAQVQGPVVSGTAVGQVVGQDYLSPSASSNIVGTVQQSISDSDVHLIQVNTSTAVPEATPYPFQITKVTETTVMVSPQSSLMTGADCQTTLPIFGLNQPFTVTNGSKIYLEVLFDLNGNALMANICCSSAGWRSEEINGVEPSTGFPALCCPVDKTNLAYEQQVLEVEFGNHVIFVGPPSGVNITPPPSATDNPQDYANWETATAALAAFTNAPAKFTQFAAYALIGFCTNSSGATGITLNGPTLNGVTNPFTVVQLVETHLQLQGICDQGVPSYIPAPWTGPFITELPQVTAITQIASNNTIVTLTDPGFTTAKIQYQLDGGPVTAYTEPISVSGAGAHSIVAFASLQGYFDSKPATFAFTV